MSRFGPSFSQGHYTRPNYLANALKDVSGTALDLMAEARADTRAKQAAALRQQFEEKQFAAQQEGAQWNREHTLGREAVEDQARTDATTYSRGRDALGDTRYAADQAWERGGRQAFDREQETGEVNRLAASLQGLNPDFAASVRGVGSMKVAAPMASSFLSEKFLRPAENANELTQYGAKLRLERQINPPAPREAAAPTMVNGMPYARGPGNTLVPFTLPGGEALPANASASKLPSSIVEELATMSTANQAVDDVLNGMKDPKNKSAFGGINMALPDRALNYLKPGTVGPRAALASAGAAIRNALSGKAVTPSEAQYLAPFIPTNGDEDDAVRVKLGEVKKFLERKAAALRAGGAVVQPGVDTDDFDSAIEARMRARAGGG